MTEVVVEARDLHRRAAGDGPLPQVGGLAGLLGIPTGLLVSEHLRAALTSRDATVALQLARAEMERLDSLNSFFASTLAIGTTVIPTYQGFPYTMTRTITCQTGNCASTNPNVQGVKRLLITMTRSGSASPLARLISYRTKHVLFGS